MKYTKQEFEQVFNGLIFEYNAWITERARTSLQQSGRFKTLTAKMESLLSVDHTKKANIISGKFVVLNVEASSHEEAIIILEFNPFVSLRFVSSYYQKNSEFLNIGDVVEISGKLLGVYSIQGYKEENEKNLLSFLNSAERYLYCIENNERSNSYSDPRLVISMEDSRNRSCFIATACYEDYNAPEVIILKQYRDNVLLKHYWGRLLVRVYYIVSPMMAKYLSKSMLLKQILKKYILAPIVLRISSTNDLR